MSFALAPCPWPSSPASTSAAPWRFGRLVDLPGERGVRRGLQWVLRRNCSLSPRQLGAVYASLCALSLVIALGFSWLGATPVLAFAGIELLAFGAALLVYARHAGDRETVTLAGHDLRVEQCFGGHVERSDFRAEWVSVEPAEAQGSLVELAGQGRRVRVGRFLRPELRAAFAQELRRALRRAGAGQPPQDSELETRR